MGDFLGNGGIMMLITNYLENLVGEGKRHVLMIVTPKGSYPTQFSRDELRDD